MRVLITGACGVTSRAIARSLRLGTRFADLALVGTDICDNPYGLYEGLYDRVVRCPRVNADGYGAWMADLCRNERIEAALIVPELEVLYWSAEAFPVPALLPPPRFAKLAVSKRRVYETLASTGLVPAFVVVPRATLASDADAHGLGYPCWVRDFGEGTSSGKGSLLAQGPDEVRAWLVLNPGIGEFMLAAYLPGRNFACHLLYDRGAVLKVASYERLEYFMARTAVSGVTGNISKGRLLNDERLEKVSREAVEALLAVTGETMHGLVAVDLKEAADGAPKVTEINVRHVAATYAFAAAGFNLAEAHLSLTLGHRDDIGPREMRYPESNMILRDIDGTPVWRADYRPLAIGEHVDWRSR